MDYFEQAPWLLAVFVLLVVILYDGAKWAFRQILRWMGDWTPARRQRLVDEK